ncbi:MAG TPA: nucleotidyltransferase domain-containing protein [Abditibacterium sp.]|jgi:hypothetical protein
MKTEPSTLTFDPRLREAVARHPKPPLFVTISGAHLYGFASPDSDYDLRGCHLLPLRDLVGLDAARETIEISETRDGLEFDIVTHDAKKYFNLLLKSSGYALEQIVSPLVVHTSPAHEELKVIAQGCVNLKFARHYFGFAENQWRLFEKKVPHRVKPLLYIYRVLLTGIHMMQTGEIEANLVTLNQKFQLPIVSDLIALKVQGEEKSPLPAADIPFFRAEYDRLRELLQTAEAQSALPPDNDVRPALNDLLVRLRLGTP